MSRRRRPAPLLLLPVGWLVVACAAAPPPRAEPVPGGGREMLVAPLGSPPTPAAVATGEASPVAVAPAPGGAAARPVVRVGRTPTPVPRTLAPVPVPVPSPVAPAGHFATLPPGSALPGDAGCAARVRRSSWEPRPENTAANHRVPAAVHLPGFTPTDGGVDARSRALADRVTGAFTGTTDEIIQGASCKWGFDEDIVRAVAVRESSWRQSHLGDLTTDGSRCQAGYTPPCQESFGLLQVRGIYHPGTFPLSRDDTAFNVDYSLPVRRVFREAYTTWLGSGGYGAGDEWGCVGMWFSGAWRDSGALRYISEVQAILARRSWVLAGF